MHDYHAEGDGRRHLMGKRSFLLACLVLMTVAVAELGAANRQGLNSLGLTKGQFEEEARRVTALAWNGEYWLIGTSDGWLVRLDGPDFEVVGRVDSEGVHSPMLWTGKYWLGTSGAFLYFPGFAYDGKDLVELRYAGFNEITEVSHALNECMLLNRVPYTSNYSILTWDGGPLSVLVEDALDLFPCKQRFEHDGMRLRVELITNGSVCLIYICNEPSPTFEGEPLLFRELLFCHGLYLYDGRDLTNMSWALPEDGALWEKPPGLPDPFWGELSNGTHWLSWVASTGKLLLFDGTEFEEVEADPGILQFDGGMVDWHGEKWLICTKGRLMRLKGGRLELAADLSGLGLESFVPRSVDWNGEYWLISGGVTTGLPPGDYLVKYDGEGVEIVQAPDGLSAFGLRKSRWPIDLGEVAWGGGRWLIEATRRSSFERGRWGYLFSYDGEEFEDIMQGLNEAIELSGGAPGRPKSLIWNAQLLAIMLLFLTLGMLHFLVVRSLPSSTKAIPRAQSRLGSSFYEGVAPKCWGVGHQISAR